MDPDPCCWEPGTRFTTEISGTNPIIDLTLCSDNQGRMMMVSIQVNLADASPSPHTITSTTSNGNGFRKTNSLIKVNAKSVLFPPSTTISDLHFPELDERNS
jgi:hypothetical protein